MMNEQTETSVTNSTEATGAASVLVRPTTFTFRKMKEADYNKLLSEYDDATQPEIAAQFDKINEGTEESPKYVYRRKPVDVQLQLPEFVLDVPEDYRETVASIIERELSSFVKSKYVDNFEPVGPHDIETYKAEIAKRGSRAVKWEYTSEQLELAAASLQNYLTEVTGMAKVGECVGKAGQGKFTRSAIQRNIGKFDDETLDKLGKHLDNWAAHVAEHDTETAEDMEVIFYMWSATLDKHREKDVVDVSSFL